ncbi:MAG TPA: cytochrome c oxidase subunit 4 [Cryptosporangiaceae bacterium]|nr:cytochrome c oxidase subunit 4 [Cryptosporangiaceae bacterium]
MKSEARIFNLVAVFLFAAAAVYAWWTANTTVGSGEGIEWAGATALVLSGGLCGMCGMYFQFVSRRIEPRPEDRPDAEISDGAGELGFFSPGSYWPVGLALAASVAGLGLAFWLPWLVLIGTVALIFAIGGLLFEYYTRSVSH